MAPVMHVRRGAGFTLIELMITVTIVAVLAAIATPSMRELILTQHVRSGASELQSALYFARSEAVKRAADIDVIPTSGAWGNGWNVQVNGGGAVLRKQDALSNQLSTMTGSTITFRSNGRLNAATAPGAIVFKSSNTRVIARCVVIDLSGRPSVLYDTDGNPSNGCN